MQGIPTSPWAKTDAGGTPGYHAAKEDFVGWSAIAETLCELDAALRHNDFAQMKRLLRKLVSALN